MSLVQGVVEIHIRQQDWDSHGHGTDPNYNSVILNAAMDANWERTTLQSGREKPVVSLSVLLDDAGTVSDQSNPAIWTLLKRYGYSQPSNARAMGDVLDQAGDARFHRASIRFQTFLNEQSEEQTLYEGLFEGLGYRNNQHPFVRSASVAPYQALAIALDAVPQSPKGWKPWKPG